MKTKLITNTKEFVLLKNDWQRLEHISPDVTYYSSFEYVSTWWDVYKEKSNLSLFIICVYENNRIVGVGPFLVESIRNKLFKYRILKFIGHGDYLDVLVDFSSAVKTETIIKEIIKEMENNSESYDVIHLTHISQNSQLCKYFLKSKYNNYFQYLIENPYLEMDQFVDLNDYKKQFNPSNVFNLRNRLKRDYNFRFVIVTEQHSKFFLKMREIHKEWQKYLKIERNNEYRKSLFDDNFRNRVFENLYNNTEKIVSFLIKTEGNEIIIYDTCFKYKGVLYSWNMAQNHRYNCYRPGKLINWEIFSYLFERPNFAKRFDFGTGRYPWKFEWTSSFNLLYQLYYVKPGNQKLIFYNKLKKIKRIVSEK